MDIKKPFRLMELDKVREVFEKSTQKPFIKTGYTKFDELIDGFYGGCVYVIGARPGTGKTTLVLNLLINLKNRNQLVFTTEIGLKQFLEKLSSRLFGIEHRRIRQDFDSVKGEILSQIEKFKDYNIHIVDEYRPSILSIRQYVETIKPEILYFDYFQNIQTNPMNPQKYQEYTRKAEEFFNIGRDYNIPIVLTSQLKRPPEDRKNGRPELGDFKETGKLEEISHVAVLLSRSANGVLVDIAKNRNGSIGEFELEGLWGINKLVEGV